MTSGAPELSKDALEAFKRVVGQVGPVEMRPTRKPRESPPVADRTRFRNLIAGANRRSERTTAVHGETAKKTP